MSDRKHRTPVRGLLAGIGAVACLALLGQPAVAEELVFPSGTVAMFPPLPTQGGGDPAGMVVYIDPQTGEIRSGPASGTQPLQVTPQEQNALSTSHQGLAQQPAAVPGGGVKLDLRGRFQNPIVVTIDANGAAKVRHLDELPSGDMN